jgi:23S rRNA (uracil1939-C5)-methyltransferase
MIKKGDELEIEIESLAFGAEGVGHYKTAEGSLAVFVEDTVPGDVVKVQIGTKKRNFARGYIVDFVKKAPIRIKPRCRHFGQCGGCVLQYLKYEDQLRIKEQQVRDAIRRLGGFDEGLVLPIIGCNEPWYYRNKMEFSFSRTVDGVLSLGLHVRRRHHDLVELTECFLLNDYIGDLVAGLRDFFRQMDSQKRIPEEMHMGSLVVREGKNTGEIMVNLIVENGEPDFCDEFTELARKALEGKKLASVYLTQIINFKGRPKKTHERVLWGEPVIHEELRLENARPLCFELSPQAFFQPNTRQAETLYGVALKAAGLTGNEVVFDLFCGAGTIGIFCAHAAKKVYGIEINESAVNNARSNAALNGISNIEFLAGDVAGILPSIKGKPDAIIVDPPRNGMDEKTVELVAGLDAGRLVYVSCNPATLARDLKLLTKTGCRLISVQPVDMFPQTAHIECVALLQK